MNLPIFIIFFFFTKCIFSQCIDSTRIDTTLQSSYCNLIMGEMDPFCGCDGKTYPNSQCALYSGVTSGTKHGGCKCLDSTVIDKNYNPLNNFYKIELVCGCNGKTYLNSYEAFYKYGITKFTKGNGCYCQDSSLIDISKYNNQVETIYDEKFGVCYFDESQAVCGCDSNSYRSNIEAVYKYGITQFRKGKCLCIDSNKIDLQFKCDSIYNPVCGCDGKAYFNSCIAENHYGILKHRSGPCPCFDSNLYKPLTDCTIYLEINSKNPQYVCGCDSITYLSLCQATCQNGLLGILKNGVCRCPDYKIIRKNVFCGDNYKPVCGCDGKSYRNICEAEDMHGIWALDRAQPCKCRDTNLIDTSINCFPEIIFDPVCGCDSITYSNACIALNKFGISNWKQGPCNYLCNDSSIINTGMKCDTIYKPVCGCDQVTYKNECEAYYKNGITRWKKGHCDSIIKANNIDKAEILVYPTIARNQINVSSSNFIIKTCSIRNSQGLVVKKFTVNEKEFKIDVNYFRSGIYFIYLASINEVLIEKVFISN